MKNMGYMMNPIGYIHTDFSEKFGIPRQSGINPELKGEIVFEPEYRVKEAFRGLEGYSHVWLLWCFSKADRERWSPTVRPPKLGGNVRMGVFATRSPFRPNPIGISSVKLESIEYSVEKGPVLHVSGIDLMDETPILDVKPYLAYADSHVEATGGFTDEIKIEPLQVNFPSELESIFPKEKLNGLLGVLKDDPRPQYQNDENRVYGLNFAGFEVKFKVSENILNVLSVKKA